MTAWSISLCLHLFYWYDSRKNLKGVDGVRWPMHFARMKHCSDMLHAISTDTTRERRTIIFGGALITIPHPTFTNRSPLPRIKTLGQSVPWHVIWVLLSKSIGTRRQIVRAFFGSIPEDFGNCGESKLPMRNKQCQKHHKKDQTTANRMTVFCCIFYEVGTTVRPRNFLLKQSGKIPVAIPRFLLRKKQKKHRHSIRRGLVFLWCFCHCLFVTNGNLIMVDAP